MAQPPPSWMLLTQSNRGGSLLALGPPRAIWRRVRGLHAPDEAVRVEHEDVPLARGGFVHEVDRAAAQGGRGRPGGIRPRRYLRLYRLEHDSLTVVRPTVNPVAAALLAVGSEQRQSTCTA